MVKEQGRIRLNLVDSGRIVRHDELLGGVRGVRRMVEAEFREFEVKFFTIPGVPRKGVQQERLVEQVSVFLANMQRHLGAITTISPEAFRVLGGMFSEDSLYVLPERRIRSEDRLLVLQARMMARMGIETKAIAAKLEKDWEVIYHWTNDIKENLWDLKRAEVRRLVQGGTAVYKVAKLLHASERTVQVWCADILANKASAEHERIAKERRLAREGLLPRQIAQKTGMDSSATSRRVKGYWKGQEAMDEERKALRVRRIKRALSTAKRKGKKVTKSGLARELHIHRGTVQTDLKRAGIILP